MSWLYWYTKYKQYRDPRRSVGGALARLDPAAADVYKLNNITASPDDVAKFIAYTIQNNLMTADDWAAILNAPMVNPDFVASVLNSPNLTADLAAAILNSITPERVVAILNSQNITPNRVVSILRSPNFTADRAQSILYAMPFNKRLVEILTSGAPNVTLGANATFSGVNRFNVLNLDGYTYTADGNPHVIIANTIIIPSNSVLAKTPTGGAGGRTVDSHGVVYSSGGSGGGGLIIIAYRLNNAGMISANGANGMSRAASYPIGSIPGSGGNPGMFALVGNDQVGAGGGSNGDRNGGGGGGRASGILGGRGGGSSIISYATYNELFESVKRAAIDWVLINVIGKSPTVTTQFINVYGSGGGSGSIYGSDVGGGGGGGGGQVIILSVEFNNEGAVTANGGDGGSGSGSGIGGGGGGGGVVYAFYKNLLSLGTLRAEGGAGGNPNGTPGTAGTAKAVAI